MTSDQTEPVTPTPAEPRDDGRPRLAPPDALGAAADAADDAISRGLDSSQVIALIADAVWRLAYERGHADGHGRAVAAVQRPDLAAFERGKAEGIAEVAASDDRRAEDAAWHTLWLMHDWDAIIAPLTEEQQHYAFAAVERALKRRHQAGGSDAH